MGFQKVLFIKCLTKSFATKPANKDSGGPEQLYMKE